MWVIKCISLGRMQILMILLKRIQELLQIALRYFLSYNYFPLHVIVMLHTLWAHILMLLVQIIMYPSVLIIRF